MNGGYWSADKTAPMDEAFYGIFDRQGRILFASPHFREVLGVGPSGQLSELNYGFFSLQETARLADAIRNALHGNGHSLRFEITTTERDPRTFSWEIQPGTDETGQLNGIHCFGYDITAQKASEKRLALLGDIIDRHVSDIVITVDTDFRVISMNRPAELLYNTTLTKVKGERIIDLSEPEYLNCTREDIYEDARMKGHHECEIRCKSGQDYQYLQVVTDAIRNSEGETEGYVLVARDITARKENEERLLYFSTLLQHISDSVITVNTNYDIVFINRSAESLYGVQSTEVVGKNFLDLYTNYIFEFRQTTLEQAVVEFQANHLWEGQIRMQRKDGKNAELHISLNPIRNLNQEIIGYISINRDLTDLMQERAKLLETRNLAESAIEGCLNPMVVLDLEGRILRINKSALEMSKAKLSSRLAVLIWESSAYEITPANRARIREAVMRAANGEPAVAFVDNITPVGRETVPLVEFSVRPVMSEGVPSHLLFEYKPIAATGLHRSQGTGQTESIFDSFMDNSPLPVWIVDRENRLISMNRYYMDAHGLSEKDLGKNLFEVINTRHTQQYRRHNAQVLRTGQALETIEYTEEQGVMRTYVVHKFPIRNGGQVELIGAVAIDITANMQAEEKLKESHERYETVARATNDLVWDLDVASGKITEMGNHAILWGRHTWHTRGYREMLEHIDEEHREAFDRSFKKAIKVKSRDLWQYECKYKDPDGTEKTLLFRSIITRDELGNATKVTGSVQDISERAKLQQELDVQREETHRLALRAQFEAQEKERNRLAIELHDHINPLLAGASLHVDIAEQDPQHRESYLLQTRSLIYECMQEIKKVSHHLSHHFLRDNSLDQAVRIVVEKMIPEDGPQVHFVFKGLEHAIIDEYAKICLLRIVQEQVANTVKHAQAKMIDINLRSRMNKLLLVISDDGVGFDTEEQAENISLSQITSRAESCSASIKITTARGKGCRLEMELPVRDPRIGN